MAQDTDVKNLIINKLTKAQYESIANPDPAQLYFITDEVISSTDVTNALGYTPYNSSNPNGYTSNVGTVTSVNNIQPDANGNVVISTHNVGEIIPSTLPLTDAGLHLLDGTLLQYGIYKEFIDYIADLYAENPNANYWTTESDWQASVTQYGSCGKFVYDSTLNTVRLPKVSDILQGTTDVSALGDLVEAGLPNHTHTSNTVQPQTIKVLYYIVIANSTKTKIQVDIDKIATDLNGKADTDLSNVTDTGYIKMAGAGMPSNRYIDLTLGASGTTYTAPANGWFTIFKEAGNPGFKPYLTLVNTSARYLSFETRPGESDGVALRLSIPAKKGDVIRIDYDAIGITRAFRFIYAEGEVK